MSLNVAINNALSGLKISQQSFAVLSQNIANANNEDYTRQTISQSSVNIGSMFGSGVQMEGINRIADEFITKNVITRSANVARSELISEYYGQVQLRLGQPGQNNSLDTYVNSFFNSISQLSVTPERSALKLNVVEKGQSLSNYVSGLAKDLHQLRNDADNQIKESAEIINSELKNLANLNRAILNAQVTGVSVNSLRDSADKSLTIISSHMDITYRTTAEGTYYVTTQDGTELLGASLNRIDYSVSSSQESFINGSGTSALTVYPIDELGNRKGSPITLATAGISTEVTTNIKSGKIKAALELRDKILPDIIAQLDSLAANLRDAMNAIHNQGVSYPPPQSLNGTTLIDPTAANNWQGTVMIAALDEFGTPLTSPYASESSKGYGLPPLKIDLAALDDGNNLGRPSYQAIIDEINHYYGVPQPRASIGDFANVELVSRSDAITAGSGTFNFDLELNNLGVGTSTFRVTNAAISGGGSITSPGSFPSSAFSLDGGNLRSTTGTIDFAVDMSGAAAGPYTVTLDVETTDAAGVTSVGQLTYTINNTAIASRNDRYAPATATGDAAIETPETTTPILTARLVDENGVEIPKSSVTGDYTKNGYLQIIGNNSNIRVGINELNSSFRGDYAVDPVVEATNFGFSHQMGLNNFFVDTGKIEGAAVAMTVTKSIIDKPQLISLGKLNLSNQPTDITANPKYTYEIGNGSNEIITAMSEIGQKNMQFGQAGTLPAVSLTFSGYAAEILAFTSALTATADETFRQEELIQQGFIERDKSIRGVNIDEEMANTIIFQNTYSANARVISVTKELFADLLQLVG